MKKKFLIWLCFGPPLLIIAIVTFPFGLIPFGLWWIGVMVLFLVGLVRWFTSKPAPIESKIPAVSRPTPTSPLGLS